MAQSSPNKNRLLEKYVQVVREDGLQTNKNVNIGINGTSAALWVSGAISSGGAFSTTGSLSATGGQVAINQDAGNNVTYAIGGAPASGSHGNNTTMVAGTTYWTQLFLDCNLTLTGVSVLVGGTGGTDSWIVALYNNAGALVANSALAGTTAGTANNMQNIAFTATYAAVGPAYYFIGLQSNGTTAKFQSYTTPGSIFITGSHTGSFDTLINPITPGTTYTNNVGPVSAVY